MAMRDEATKPDTRVDSASDAERGAFMPATSPAASPSALPPDDPNGTDTPDALEQRSRARVLATGQLLWSATSDGAVSDGGDWCVFTGLAPGQVSGDGLFAAVHPDDRSRARRTWEDALSTGRGYETRYRVRRHDGAFRWMLVRVAPLEDANGRVREWIGTATDITEIRHGEDALRVEARAEEALRESESQLAHELEDATRLQAISTQLIQEGKLDDLYVQILDAAITIMQSDMGCMQMLHPERNELHLLTARGFSPEAAVFWEWVQANASSPCAMALRTGGRALVPDIESCDSMAGTEELDFYRSAGVRAIQSTPLVSRDGHLVGVLSTHWRTRHEPTPRDLRLLDVLARQAADLIERKQGERALAHLAAIITSTSDAVLSKTLDGEITSWNASAEQMFGYSASEMVGQPIFRLIPPELHADEERLIARLRAGERIEPYETLHLTKAGRPLEVSVTISLVRDAAGAIIGVSKIMRDITERRRTERLLSEQNHLLELIASGCSLEECLTELTGAVARLQLQTHAAVFVADEARTRIDSVYASDFPVALGAGLQGAPINDLALGASRTAIYQGHAVTCEDIANDDRWSSGWRELCMAHGVLACYSEPIMGAHGRALAALMLCFDVPRLPGEWEQRIAHFGAHIASLAIARDRAEQAVRESERRKDEFLGIASHELRTPLTSITANVQMAERALRGLVQNAQMQEAASGDQQRDEKLLRLSQLLERSDRQLMRLDRLVGDLLDVSRIQSGRLDLRLEACDLLTIVREAVHEQRSAWPHRAIELTLPRRRVVLIHADADRIGQVVTNLLTNALKYSADGTDVAVSVRMQGTQARVAVRDSGPGMTEAQREHLFERFYRVPGIEQQSGSGVGLGLGLHICTTIVERHGGSIGLDSAPGEGSTFWFTLPVAQETQETPDLSES